MYTISKFRTFTRKAIWQANSWKSSSKDNSDSGESDANTPFNEIINLDEVVDLLESKKNGISGVESYGKMRLFL